MIETLKYAYKTRRAWWFTATARTRDRFSRTALGSLWLGVSNLLSIACLSIVYGTVFKVDSFRQYVVFLGIGIATWNIIAVPISSAPGVFRIHGNNLRNLNIHPIFYTLEEWAFQIQSMGQSLALVLTILSIVDNNILYHLPVAMFPLLNIVLLIYWVPTFICIAGSKYEDVYQLVPIALQILFLVSPVLYEKEALGKASWIADLNPIYVALSLFRNALIRGDVDLKFNTVFLILNIAGMLITIGYLNRSKRELPFLV